MKILITSPSLDSNMNISGISTVTQFIIKSNPANEYFHFELGKKDNERRNLLWFINILKIYMRWTLLMLNKKELTIHFNLALCKRSIIRDAPLIMIARMFRKRIIIHLHGGDFLMHKKNPKWMIFILRLIFSGNIPKIVLSPLEKEILIKKFNHEHIFVLPNCIELKDAIEFDRDYSKKEMLILLFLGRITVEKGIDFIFQALESLKKKGIKFKFIMAGKGPEEKLYVKKFKDILGLDFEFKGVVSGEQKTELLKKCNVFLLPSFFEGLPMALLESMSFGLVPITTHVGSIKYIVKNGINGIIVPKHSSDEIVFAIEKLSENNECMQELSKNARQHILEKYDPCAYVANLNEMYNYE